MVSNDEQTPNQRSPWRSRKRWLLAITVVLAIIFVPYLVGRWGRAGRQIRIVSDPTNAVAAGQPRVTTLKLLTFNIAHGRGPIGGNWNGPAADDRRRVQNIAQLIQAEDPDIVVLNEVDFNSTWSGHQNQAAAIAEATGYPYWVEQRNFDFGFIVGSWQFGNAVLSKYPITAAEAIEYPPLSDWENALAGSKQGVVCSVELSPGQQLRVIGVHLEVRSEATRVAAAKQLIATSDASEIPTIAAGDFNSSPDDYPGAKQSPDGENAMELLSAAKEFQLPDVAQPTLADMTFTPTQPEWVIDWILIPPGAKYVDYRVLQVELSDHRPVMATIELPAATSLKPASRGR